MFYFKSFSFCVSESSVKATSSLVRCANVLYGERCKITAFYSIIILLNRDNYGAAGNVCDVDCVHAL